MFDRSGCRKKAEASTQEVVAWRSGPHQLQGREEQTQLPDGAQFEHEERQTQEEKRTWTDLRVYFTYFSCCYFLHLKWKFIFYKLWKKLKINFLLSQKFCHLLKILSSCTFFINCSKTKCGTRTAYFCLSSSWHFLCWADDIFEKVSSSGDSSSCISSSWPWLFSITIKIKKFLSKC